MLSFDKVLFNTINVINNINYINNNINDHLNNINIEMIILI